MPQPRNIDIAEVLRDARLGDLRALAEEPVGYDQLHRATSALFDLLDARQVDYVLVGGLAVLQYLPGRNTRDIELILSPSDLDRLPELELLSRDNDFARGSFEGVQLDLLLTSNRVFDIVRAKYATVQRFADRDIRCATPEGLVLMKLLALPSLYRQGDFGRITLYEGDVQWLMQDTGVDPAPLIEQLKPEMLATDIAQIQVIAREIADKIERFESRSD